MEKKFIEIAQSLLDASFEECEKALAAVKPEAREKIIALIFKKYHEKSAAEQARRVARSKTSFDTPIAPLIKMRMSQRGKAATITYAGKKTTYDSFTEALAFIQIMRELHGACFNTLCIGTAHDVYRVRCLVPNWGTKRRVNICISATTAAE